MAGRETQNLLSFLLHLNTRSAPRASALTPLSRHSASHNPRKSIHLVVSPVMDGRSQGSKLVEGHRAGCLEVTTRIIRRRTDNRTRW